MEQPAIRALAIAVLLAAAGCDRAANQPPAAPAPATAPRPPAGPERLVVAFGDSLYAGYGLKREEAWPARLERALWQRGVNARVVNAGVSGETTAGGRRRLGFVLDSQPRRPDLVIVGLGGNDMLRGLPPAAARANLDAILAELKRRGIPAMLTGMLAAPNLGADYARAFNAIYPELARRYDAALVPFFLAPVVDRADLIQPDHIHPTAEGVEAIVAGSVDAVAGALGNVPSE